MLVAAFAPPSTFTRYDVLAANVPLLYPDFRFTVAASLPESSTTVSMAVLETSVSVVPETVYNFTESLSKYEPASSDIASEKLITTFVFLATSSIPGGGVVPVTRGATYCPLPYVPPSVNPPVVALKPVKFALVPVDRKSTRLNSSHTS